MFTIFIRILVEWTLRFNLFLVKQCGRIVELVRQIGIVVYNCTQILGREAAIFGGRNDGCKFTKLLQPIMRYPFLISSFIVLVLQQVMFVINKKIGYTPED